jgi:hypothetical protein
MTISIRRDHDTETALRRRLEHDGLALPDFVPAAIREKLARTREDALSCQLGESLFGRYSSGEQDRSRRRRELLCEHFHVKHRR